jgi:hypothetical protein
VPFSGVAGKCQVLPLVAEGMRSQRGDLLIDRASVPQHASNSVPDTLNRV